MLKIKKLKYMMFLLLMMSFNLTCFDVYNNVWDNAASGNYNLTIVETYLNNARLLIPDGDSTMKWSYTFPVSNYMSSSYGDFDNDGNMDILMISTGDPVIYYGDGHGNIRSSFTIITGITNSRAAVVSDFDDDGDIDIFLITELQGLYYLQNNGNLNFAVIPSGAPFSYSCVTSGDIDGDGNYDIIIGDATNNNIVLKENDLKQAGWLSLPIVSIGTGISDLKTADFDSDGDLDILVVSNGTGHQLYLNNGEATFTAGWSGAKTADYSSLSLADFDNDGDVDAFVSNSTSGSYDGLLINNGHAVFSEKEMTSFKVPPAVVTYKACAGDLNLDGKIDIIRSASDGVWIHLNEGGGSFSSLNSIAIAAAPVYSLSAGVFR